MRKFILMASAISLAVPLAPAASAQSGWTRHERSTVGYTLRSVRMRAGPDLDYPAVRTIQGNRRVDVYGCLNDWSWCDIGYRSDRGWVTGRLLGADYRGRRQSFGMVAPYLGILVLSFRFGDYWDNHYRGRPFYSDRNRWERHYYDNYSSHWGTRPTAPEWYRQQGDQQRSNTRQDRHNSEYGNRAVIPPRRDITPQAAPTYDHHEATPGLIQQHSNTGRDERSSGHGNQIVIPPRRDVTPQAAPTYDHRSANPGSMRNQGRQPAAHEHRAANPQANPSHRRNDAASNKPLEPDDRGKAKIEAEKERPN